MMLLLLSSIVSGCSREPDPAARFPPEYRGIQDGGYAALFPEPMGEWGETVDGVRARIRWAGVSRTAGEECDAISFVVELENLSDEPVRLTLGPWWDADMEPRMEMLPDLQALVWDGSSWRKIKGGFELGDHWEDAFDIAPARTKILKFTRFAEPPLLRQADLLVKVEIGTVPMDLGDA
jgi:hypothetical protein